MYPSSPQRDRSQGQYGCPAHCWVGDAQRHAAKGDLEAPAGPPGPLWRGRGNDSWGGEWAHLGHSPSTEPTSNMWEVVLLLLDSRKASSSPATAAFRACGSAVSHGHTWSTSPLSSHLPGSDGHTIRPGQRYISRSYWIGLLGDLLSWLNRGGARFMSYTCSLSTSFWEHGSVAASYNHGKLTQQGWWKEPDHHCHGFSALVLDWSSDFFVYEINKTLFV